MKKFLREAGDFLSVNKIFFTMFSSLIITSVFFIFRRGSGIFEKESVLNIKLPFVLISVAAVTCGLLLICFILRKISFLYRHICIFSAAAYAFMLIWYRETDEYFTFAVILFFFIIACAYLNNDGFIISFSKIRLSNAVLIGVVAAFGIAAVVFVSYNTIVRLRVFGASTYDFGIFAQMYENMAKTGLPVTTLERNVELSHFAVHFSPVFYLFLPLYMIFRAAGAEFLLVIQAVFIVAGVIPFALICKKFALDNFLTLMFSVVYILNPFFLGGAFYDFHENVFLPFFLLFLIYFIICGKDAPAIVFMILSLSVKEDAFIYVIIAGIFALFYSKKRLLGIIICVFSVIYFIAVAYFMTRYGTGVMDTRYDDYLIFESDSLLTVVINVVKNPALLVKNVLSEDKIIFLVQLFASLGLLCFSAANVRHYYLFIPLVIVNLASNYAYQHVLGFQYIYGSVTLILVLAALNLTRADRRKQLISLFTAAASSVLIFVNSFAPEITGYNAVYNRYYSAFEEAKQVFAEIPPDAVVAASTFLTAQILQVEQLYDFGSDFYGLFDREYDYIVFDLRSIDWGRYGRIAADLEEAGYELTEARDFFEIYKRD